MLFVILFLDPQNSFNDAFFSLYSVYLGYFVSLGYFTKWRVFLRSKTCSESVDAQKAVAVLQQNPQEIKSKLKFEGR